VKVLIVNYDAKVQAVKSTHLVIGQEVVFSKKNVEKLDW
jgi:hypothetical protein